MTASTVIKGMVRTVRYDCAALGIWAIRRTETGCQRSASSATSTWESVIPQPSVGRRGISFCPVALMSTTCGGITARAGHTVPGRRVTAGWRSALISPVRLPVDRWSVAVVHRPLPGIVCALFTHRSTLTGTKDTGSAALVASVGQPTQATVPSGTGPPLTVGTGVADVDGAAGAVALLGAPAGAPDCAAPHPAASAPAASNGTAKAHARRPARPVRPACAMNANSVLMGVPRFR